MGLQAKRGEHPIVVGDRILARTHLSGPLRGSQPKYNGLLGVSEWRGLIVVMRNSRQYGHQVSAVDINQSVTDPPMELEAFERRKFVIQYLAYQGVRKPIAVSSGASRFDELRASSALLLQYLQQLDDKQRTAVGLLIDRVDRRPLECDAQYPICEIGDRAPGQSRQANSLYACLAAEFTQRAEQGSLRDTSTPRYVPMIRTRLRANS